MKEKISALLDAELSGTERQSVLHELSRNHDLHKVWERYHLARAAMRNELEVLAPLDFADRVAARIRSEAPLALPARLNQTIFANRFARGAVGLAIAASVAVIAVGGMQYFGGQVDPPGALPQLAQNTMPDSYARADAAGASAQERALNAFLMEHNELMPSSGVNGVMSYVRLAAYNNHKE
jgi:negative regulator of sigma E activity